MTFSPRGRHAPKRAWLRVLVALSGLALPALMVVPARASDHVPGEIQEYLDLDCTPVCTMCHTTLEGGTGTAKAPFGAYMREVGVFSPLDGAVAAAMEAGRTHDADMDGVMDTQEIIANTDPGSTEDNPICSDAQYGCGAAQIAPRARGQSPLGSSSGWLAAFAVAAALLLRQRGARTRAR